MNHKLTGTVLTVLIAAFSVGSEIDVLPTEKVLAITISVDQNSSSRQYIGLRYEKLPKNLTSLGGWLVGDANTRYGVSNVREGNKQFLMLERLMSTNRSGQRTWQVIDVLDIPPLPPPLSLTSLGCSLNGKRDPELVTIAFTEDTEQWTTFVAAWRANRRTGKFEEIPDVLAKNIVCENPSWGG
jgi:hypothetical protein